MDKAHVERCIGTTSSLVVPNMNERPTGGRTAGRLCSQENSNKFPFRKALCSYVRFGS